MKNLLIIKIINYLIDNNVSFDNTLISDIDFVSIEEALNEHPYIKKAEIYTGQNGQVNLHLKKIESPMLE